MAKMKLNKKVALIGTGVFLLVGLAIVAAFLYMSRDPEKFAKAGDQAALRAQQAQTQEEKEEAIELAGKSYGRAFAYYKDDASKIEVLYKIADLNRIAERWDKIMSCWAKIIQIDPANVKSRYLRLKYFYITADSGVRTLWK